MSHNKGFCNSLCSQFYYKRRGTGYTEILKHIAILNMMLNKLHAEQQKPYMHNNFYDNTMKFEELCH